MLTFKRLIHRERKNSSNPMNLRDLLFWSMPSQALHGGDMTANSKEGHGQKFPCRVGKRKSIQNYKRNIHKPRLCANTWIPFTNKYKCQPFLLTCPSFGQPNWTDQFLFCLWSVSTPMFSGLSSQPTLGLGWRWSPPFNLSVLREISGIPRVKDEIK